MCLLYLQFQCFYKPGFQNRQSTRAVDKTIEHSSTMRSRSFMRYELDKIIDWDIKLNQPHFLCHWKGLEDHCYDTWEPISDLMNIKQYLQYWMNKRKEEKDQKKRNRPVKNVRRLLHGDQPMPRISDRDRKLGEAIVSSRRNRWEKYLQNDDDYLGLTDNRELPAKRMTRAREEHQKRQTMRMAEKRALLNERYPEEVKKGFKVTGQVDMDDIVQIVRVFNYADSRVMQVRLKNCKLTNMMEEDVRKHKPQLFLQFCEDFGIKV